MTIENARPIEQESNAPLPTTLHLFRYRKPEMDALGTKASSALQLEENINNINNSLNKLNVEKDGRLARLSETREEIDQQFISNLSSISCGAAYIEMRDEMPDLPPKDFMDFFKLCLTINSRITKGGMDSVERRGGESLLMQTLSLGEARRVVLLIAKILDETVDSPPPWFWNNRYDAWRRFVSTHANFTAYINQDLMQSLTTHKDQALAKAMELTKVESATGPTLKGEYPDWFLENSELLPAREEVQEELAEDKEQRAKLIEALAKIEIQEKYLNNTVLEKTQKATERLRQQTAQVFLDSQDFSDVILLNSLNIQGNSPETVIKSYAQSENILTDQEPIALYIEKKLKEGKILQSAQHPIDANFVELFTSAFEHIKAQQKDGSTVAEFVALRKSNKKAFSALNYDLKPFLEILSSDEISLLQGLLTESKDKPTELFIWDMAGLISSNVKEKGNLPKA